MAGQGVAATGIAHRLCALTHVLQRLLNVLQTHHIPPPAKVDEYLQCQGCEHSPPGLGGRWLCRGSNGGWLPQLPWLKLLRRDHRSCRARLIHL